MKFLLSCCLLVLHLTRTFSVTISSPGVQRKSQVENCVFQWNINGYFITYTIQKDSAGNLTALGNNTRHIFDSRKSVIKLWIWNIQTSDAGNYFLSISTGNSTQVNSAALLFVYGQPSAFVTLAVGRNPATEGDTIELNCTCVSNSLPVAFRSKMYYSWDIGLYGYLRNISSGPALLENGDALPGYSIKNDGRSLVVASAQNPDNEDLCCCQEEGSPSKACYSSSLQVNSKPYTYNFQPANRKCNRPLSGFATCHFSYAADPPLTSHTNWSVINALPLTISSNVSGSIFLYFQFFSSNSYGNYSVTLTNSIGSTTATFQVLPPGPPDVPSNFSVQYTTHSLVSLQWRCMWNNGYEQNVFVRLIDVTNNEEVDIQIVILEIYCYNSPYSTLFQNNIQPETNYEASIWSTNTLGSSNVVKVAVRTSKRLIFDTSSANILIMENEATINFRVADSPKAALFLNVTCCVEITTVCSSKLYLIANTDNQIVYDILPTGNEYVFDFTVYDTDGYSYMSTMAIVKGVRVSRIQYKPIAVTPNPDTEKAKGLLIAVIVLAILLGFAILGLIGGLIAFLVYKRSQKHQPSNLYQPPPAGKTRPSNANGLDTTTQEYEADINYEQISNPTVDSSNYTPLHVLPKREEGSRY